MKKALLLVTLVLGICASVSSLETENWASFSLSLDNLIEGGETIEDMYMGSLGIGLGLYSFFNNGNLGLFFDIGLLIPVFRSQENVYGPIAQYGFTIGPGYKHNINEKMNLHFGAGFNMQVLSLYRKIGNEELHDTRVMYGIGGDAGFQYDLTDLIHLSAGLKLILNFANYITTEASSDGWKTAAIPEGSYGWVNSYAMIGIRPYIAIGIYSYGGSNLGKPQKNDEYF